MKDWKNSFRLLKYGHQAKINVGVAMFFFVIGIILFSIGRAAIIAGSMFIVAACSFFSQLSVRVEPAGLIASSPKRRMLGIHLPNATAGAGILLAYLIIRILLAAEEKVSGKLLFSMYLILFGVQLFMGVASRLLLMGSIIFWCLTMACSALALGYGMQWIPDTDIAMVNRIGFLLVIAGAVFGAVLRKLVYPLPISKSEINQIFRKQI